MIAPKHGIILFFAVAFVLLIAFIQYKDTSFISNLHTTLLRTDKNATEKTSLSASDSRRWALTSFHRLMSSYRSCLSKNMNEAALHNQLPGLIERCLGKAIWQLWDVRMVTNKDETKLVILPSLDAGGECVEITLGVGNDIVAEQQLRRLLPECKLFGADPIYESGKAFKEVGEYFQLAVSGETGVERGHVLDDQQYRLRDVHTVSLADFLNDYAKVSKIDHLWMDNEGAEYKIFPKYFMSNNTPNITVCQINVEMHLPFKEFNVSQDIFNRLINDIVAQSSFLPVFTVLAGGHIRSFYINVVDNYCVEKFLLHNLFGF